MSSLFSPLGKALTNIDIVNRLSNQTPTTDLSETNIALQKIANRQPEPFTFIQSNNNALSSNVADGVLIIQSPVMNHGERGVVEDLNVNFTTIAGTVRIVKVLGYNGSILIDITRTITGSTSGVGSVVLEEGEAIAIMGQVAGAGTFSVLFSGRKYRIGV